MLGMLGYVGALALAGVVSFIAIYGFSGGVRNTRLTLAHRIKQGFWLLASLLTVAGLAYLATRFI